MDVNKFIESALIHIEHIVSFCGVLIILVGVMISLFQYIYYLFADAFMKQPININQIRLNLGRVLTLGLEFIVAADLIKTTSAPDYYTVGIVASIVLIRTVLSFTLNREINTISRNEIIK